MAKASPIQQGFNAGEWTPALDGQVGQQKYVKACSLLENFVPMVQGPARRRAGTKYVASTKTAADRVWFKKFEFNVTQAYVLEFGDKYIRFYTDHGQVQDGNDPYEVTTDYAVADLTNDDGTCAIDVVQSGDVLYICVPGYQQRKLSRNGATDWTIAVLATTGGPFKDLNATSTTVYASAATGSVTLTASADLWTANHVGSLFYLEQKSVIDVEQWEQGKTISTGDVRRYNGVNYKALNDGTTGSVPPTHTEGAVYDGDSGVQWQYQDPGYGYAEITAFASATSVTATVKNQIPAGAVGSTNASDRWALGAWSDEDGWPTKVTFFRERLVFARDQQEWLSVAGDFENFNAKDKSGTVTADMAISIRIESDQVNQIEWLSPGSVLLTGTAGGEFSVAEISTSEALGPSNIAAKHQSGYGSRGVNALRVGSAILFVQRSGLKLRELAYSFETDGFISHDLTVLSEHITAGGIIDMTYAQEPDSVVWLVRDDGKLLGFTYNREQDVLCWHGHTIGGTDVVVESVCAIPSPDGDHDELWMIVKRVINGATARYVEYMQAPFATGDDLADAFYVDAGLTYDSTAASTISGLDHLEGETVDILADGAPHPQRTVSDGEITLQAAHSTVQIGLACHAKLKTMRLEAGAADGTAQGKTKRITNCTIRFLNTLGAKAGPDADTLDEIEFRSASDKMDEPPPLFSGDKFMNWPGGYDTDGYVMVTQEQPLPMTVVAIMPQLETQDR